MNSSDFLHFIRNVFPKILYISKNKPASSNVKLM